MNIVAVPPHMLRWVPRNAENADCTIVALQLATGMTYETVLSAAIAVNPKAVTRGLWWGEMKRVLKALGFDSRVKRPGRYDVDEDTGVLAVRSKGYEHVVYLWRGRIIEPVDQALWVDPEDYLKHKGLKAGGLLVLWAANF